MLPLSLSFWLSVCASSVSYCVLKWVWRLYLYTTILSKYINIIVEWPCTGIWTLFQYTWWTTWCKMTRKLGIFNNLKMFAVFKLRYLLQYIIYVIIIYIYELLTSNRIHMYSTHISAVYKDVRRCCQIVEPNKFPRKCQFFLCQTFDLQIWGNYENDI